MKLRTGVPLAVSAAAVGMFAVAPAALAGPSGTVFTGAARSLTAEVAIQGAIEDAMISASAEQLYTCTQVGAPRLFEHFDDPFFGHIFFAEADVSCTA